MRILKNLTKLWSVFSERSKVDALKLSITSYTEPTEHQYSEHVKMCNTSIDGFSAFEGTCAHCLGSGLDGQICVFSRKPPFTFNFSSSTLAALEEANFIGRVTGRCPETAYVAKLDTVCPVCNGAKTRTYQVKNQFAAAVRASLEATKLCDQ
jgi:hypothetical protein